MSTRTCAVGRTQDVHREELCSLLDPEVLHDVGVVEVLEGLVLGSQGIQDLLLARVVRSECGAGDLHLLDGHDIPRGDIHAHVYTAVAPLAYEFTADPQEGC